MNLNDAFPSKFLKASDLHGAEPIVTIDKVLFEPVGRSREMKPVVYFVGKEKGLILNVTNGRKITDLCGSEETDDWTGKKIKLYSTETEFAGETVDCIRIKAAAVVKPAKANGKAAKPAPPPVVEPETDDFNDVDESEIPF
jgi:hypothetical protein